MLPTAHDHWTHGPDRPLLGDGAVHVWRADLTMVPDDVCDLLCDEERARAERLLSERSRRLWMRSQGVLRELLGRYLQMDPRGLRFATGAHGKPALSDDARVSFNLSHAGGLALYALTVEAAVGVDVELAGRSRDVLAIAARMFGAADAARLGDLDSETREREFLRLWVRREAELKCAGVGIGGADAVGDERRPWIAELEVWPLAAAAAVAVETPPRELHCWDWAPPAGTRSPRATLVPAARGSSPQPSG